MATEKLARIKKLRKELGLTQDEFSKRIKVSRSNYGNIETGSVGLTERVLSDICEAFKVNRDWLENGEGEMFEPEKTEDKIIEAFSKVVKMPDDAFTKQFIAALAELTPEQWEMVEEFANKIVGNRDKKEKKDD
jgi:transcriptional regulator with XRE-family HTH domain